MIDNGRARLVEYNARFGDPECQVLIMRLGAQALDLLLACSRRASGIRRRVHWAEDHALTVVMGGQGLSGSYAKGTVRSGASTLARNPRPRWSSTPATTARDGQFTATGGRVLNITARGATLAEAQAKAYAMVDAIDWPEGFCRRISAGGRSDHPTPV